MLEIDAPRNSSLEISYKRLEWRRIREWILTDDIKQLSGLLCQWTAFEPLRVLPRLIGVDQFVAHKSISRLQFATCSSIPWRIDSLIPGMLTKYKVS